MQKTIQLTVGIVIGMIFFGIMVQFVRNSLFNNQDVEILMNQTFISGDLLVVSWKTSTETNGLVEFTDGVTLWHERDDEFSKTHRILFNISAVDPGTIITHTINACSANGECIHTPKYSISI